MEEIVEALNQMVTNLKNLKVSNVQIHGLAHNGTNEGNRQKTTEFTRDLDELEIPQEENEKENEIDNGETNDQQLRSWRDNKDDDDQTHKVNPPHQPIGPTTNVTEQSNTLENERQEGKSKRMRDQNR
ncbi:uncharacterized protein LOC120089070 [Benincasa hispida]|uniref:uncharacterized protein LOC120089070 n=1 Tax=Benincasa hispida TaxID=102211 RepID=UPI001901EB01|nr:uncharacterized protein LOC120089070 [Benincasa hispida]